MTRCVFALALAFALMGSGAMAQCEISGTITAAPSGDPSLPAWAYTVLDGADGTCDCADFAAALLRVDPAGESTGDTGTCSVVWDSFLECRGDPSIPGADGILLKFEPRVGACEPGPVGSGTFVFYSELAPVPVDDDIISQSDKFGLSYCFGHLTGVFPGMACNPVPNLGSTWSAVKGLYR
jgi:hypothetical protein